MMMTFRRNGLQVCEKDKTSGKTSRSWERICISKGRERVKILFSEVNESQRVGQDLATEQQQSQFKKKGFKAPSQEETSEGEQEGHLYWR